MNNYINKIRQRARIQPKTIILPESGNPRIKQAARIIRKQKIARVFLNPARPDIKLIEKYTQDFFNLRKHKGITLDEARKTISHPLYYAAMMVRDGLADGFVAGADHATPDVAKASIYCLGVDPQIKIASSCFIMVLPDKSWGEKGVIVFADCGIVPEPDSRQLASIAVSAAGLARRVLGICPRVALLSYSTKGSAKGRAVDKVTEALAIVRQISPELLADGEMQADAAIMPDIAKTKQADKILGGKANVLIFPCLDAGNISYKLVQRFTKARAIGPIILGLNRPCSDLSRGCSVEDIVDCVAVTAVRAQKA